MFLFIYHNLLGCPWYDEVVCDGETVEVETSHPIPSHPNPSNPGPLPMVVLVPLFQQADVCSQQKLGGSKSRSQVQTLSTLT